MFQGKLMVVSLSAGSPQECLHRGEVAERYLILVILESECASLDPVVSEVVRKQCLRPQGNRAAKEEYKNKKMRDATICT
jgi:hypothetical protein